MPLIDISKIKLEKELSLAGNPSQILLIYGEGKIPLDKAKVKKLVSILKMEGELPPVRLSSDHMLIDGHHRYMAYKLAGKKEIPFEIK